jgi:hypothetical protein
MPKINLTKENVINEPTNLNYFRMLYNRISSQGIRIKGFKMRYKHNKHTANYLFNIDYGGNELDLEKLKSDLEKNVLIEEKEDKIAFL